MDGTQVTDIEKKVEYPKKLVLTDFNEMEIYADDNINLQNAKKFIVYDTEDNLVGECESYQQALELIKDAMQHEKEHGAPRDIDYYIEIE